MCATPTPTRPSPDSRRPTELKLYEAGVTYSGHGFLGTIRGFRTEFNNQSWPSGTYLPDPNYSISLFGNSDTNGFDVDAIYRPEYQPLHAFSVHGQLTYQSSTLSGVSAGVINNTTGVAVSDPSVIAQAASFYNGHSTQHTPGLMYAFTPQYDLPDHRGNIYVRYQYTGQVFADAGNGLILPGYGVLSVGGTYDITPKLNLNISVSNVNNAAGPDRGQSASGSDPVGGQRLLLRPRHRRHQRHGSADLQVLSLLSGRRPGLVAVWPPSDVIKQGSRPGCAPGAFFFATARGLGRHGRAFER